MKPIASLFGLLLCACTVSSKNTGPHPSGPLATSDINASFSAQSDGTTIQVYAALLNDGFLTLDPGDAFTAQIAGAPPIALIESRDGDKVHFVGSFAQPADKSTVSIALSRGGGKASAPASKVDLPKLFTLTEPIPAQLSAGGTIPIRLSGFTSYYVAVEVNGACLKNGGGKQTVQLTPEQHADVPLSSFPVDSLAVLPCDLDVFVRLELQGTIDPAFKPSGNGFEGLQRLAFKSTLVK